VRGRGATRSPALLLALLGLCGASARAAEPGLQGAWGSGLDGYQVVVAGSKACGSWQYVATSRYYEGYFLGTVSSGQLDVQLVCGTPGSTTAKWCPGLEPMRTEPEEVGWEAPRDWGPMQVCHGRLVFRDKGRGCTPTDEWNGYARAKPAEARHRMQELLSAIDTYPDLAACKAARQVAPTR